MQVPQHAVLLRIYTDQDALVGDQTLTELIVMKARHAHLAGATVLRGRMGFGQASQVHSQRAFDLNDNLPLVVEIVDEEQKLRSFIASLSEFRDIGLITLEKVEVVRYGRPQITSAG